jgi:hypothetical protein
MKLTIDNPKFVIYDEVLESEDFKNVWKWCENEQYFTINSSNWLKVWRLSDGTPMGGPEYYHSKSPFESVPLNLVHQHAIAIANRHPQIVGDWNEIIFRSYVYPRGSRIDWHNDQGYTAALILYTHDYWSANWGGELMIAEIPKNHEYKNVGGQIDTSWKNDFINIWGAGNYVMPKPNRMVLTPAGVWHSINRVDADAGDHCRCSIVCFFKQT